jgi:hypothetical protein
MPIGVAQSGVGFVKRVPRSPHAVQIEPSGPDVSVGDVFLEDVSSVASLGIAERSKVTGAALVLDFLEFGDKAVRTLFEAHIAGGGIHQADGGQIMAGDVTGELFALHRIPTSIAIRLGFKSGADPVPSQ